MEFIERIKNDNGSIDYCYADKYYTYIVWYDRYERLWTAFKVNNHEDRYQIAAAGYGIDKDEALWEASTNDLFAYSV